MKLGISLVLGLVSLVSYGQTPVGMSSSAAFAPTPPNPVTTDSWVQKAKLTASDSTGLDGFGFSVYASGNIIMVGAPEGSFPRSRERFMCLSNRQAAYAFGTTKADDSKH
jgi:hypothetical protein